ncbi:site-specific integrase [Gabonibacter chumensis]|uniref:site-specific integrase n=1 Tax=Gabonibacter chumensis TaxID=2972474 RepID=UPI002572E725|nr:site-specific integrase [Gabonibacter chumensis]MCR9012645.1 site-specific integrase [Gabonibacter chumensis]
MKRSTFKVLFYLKRQSEKNGKVPVMGRITINGTVSQFSCKLSVSPKLWDTEGNRAAGKSVEARQINEKLENIKTNIGKQYQRISDRDSFVTAEKVKNAWLGFGDEHRLLLQTFDEYLQEFAGKRVGKDRSEGTLREYRTRRDRLAAFLQYEYGLSDIPFRELKREFAEKFVVYLSTVRGLRSTTIFQTLKKLHAMVYLAVSKGWISVHPFPDVWVVPQSRERRFLDENEIQQVIDAHLPHYKTAIVRDIFVFCTFTGLAYADVKKLTHDDLHTDPNGDMWIIDSRQKTGTPFRVQLLPVAKQLVEKYRRLSLPGGAVFPVPCRNSYNISLRTIARRAGLSFVPSSHVGRHSFATSVCLSQGVPIETVSKMLGHKHITTTQIYAKITNDKIRRDMANLRERIGDKFKIA